MVTRRLAWMTAAATVALPMIVAVQATRAQNRPPQKVEAIPAPAEQMKQLAYFNGEWSCTGTVPQSPQGPGYSFQATVQSQTSLNGYWYLTRYEQTAPPGKPSLTAQGYWGWVPQSKEFRRFFADNQGGYDQATSPGWQADKFIWTGECNCAGEIAPFRHTFAKKSESQFTDRLEVKGRDGWQVVMENNCQKAGKLAHR